MRTSARLHRPRTVRRSTPEQPVVIVTIPTRVSAHCGACGESVEITGDNIREETNEWCASHWLPSIDEMDIGTLQGGYLGTWRKRAAR